MQKTIYNFMKTKTDEPINTIEDEAETYFIQLVFMKNRDLLKKSYHELYDALFNRYLEVYKLGKKYKVSLRDIDKKFLNDL